MSVKELLYLWHPGTQNIFSGYGLPLTTSLHLVGVIMVDRPKTADPAWLEEIQKTFGNYQLVTMTQRGERGILCQMLISKKSVLYLRTFNHPLTLIIHQILLPLLKHPPEVTLTLAWDQTSSLWVSTIAKET